MFQNHARYLRIDNLNQKQTVNKNGRIDESREVVFFQNRRFPYFPFDFN